MDLVGILTRFIKLTLERLITRKKCLHVPSVDLPVGTTHTNYFCEYVVKTLVDLGYRYEVLNYRYKVLSDGVVYDKDWDLPFTVDFERRTCSCKMWDQNLYPCIHAIAILHTRHEYYKVLSYVDSCYQSREI